MLLSPSHACIYIASTCECLHFLIIRSGLGVAGAQAHEHGATILKQGFSLKKCEDVVCFTHKPGDKVAEEFNRTLVELSGGQIPPLAELRFLSVGGCHTNTWLRAVKASCITHQKGLQDAQGHLDPHALSAGKPGFLSALEQGLNWLIVDHRRCR